MHKGGGNKQPGAGTSKAAEGNDLRITAQELKIQGRR